jgi:hypothetical protein
LWEFVSTTVTIHLLDLISLDLHDVKEARVHQIILDGVKYHLIPHLAKKMTTKEMWDELTKLYENKNKNMKMGLRENIHNTRMAKGESVASYQT